MNHEQGFTIAELMVAIGILVVLATIALPNVVGWAANQRLKGAARDLVSHFQWARLEAVKRKTNIGLTFSVGALPSFDPGQGGGYTVFVDDGAGGGIPGNRQRDGSEIELKSIPMPTGIALTSAAFTGTPDYAAGYNARGFPVGGNGGAVRLSNKSRSYDINMAPSSGGISLSGPIES